MPCGGRFCTLCKGGLIASEARNGGFLHPNSPFYRRHYALQVFINVCVCKSQNSDSVLLQKIRSFLIVSYIGVFVMLPSVDLDRKLLFWAVKVQNIRADTILTIKMHRCLFQITMPKHAFLPGRIALFSVFSCVIKIVGIVWNHNLILYDFRTKRKRMILHPL